MKDDREKMLADRLEGFLQVMQSARRCENKTISVWSGDVGVVAEAVEALRIPSFNDAIEAAAKVAAPWSGFWLDAGSTDADRAVVEVRTKIAATIRALALPAPGGKK